MVVVVFFCVDSSVFVQLEGCVIGDVVIVRSHCFTENIGFSGSETGGFMSSFCGIPFVYDVSFLIDDLEVCAFQFFVAGNVYLAYFYRSCFVVIGDGYCCGLIVQDFCGSFFYTIVCCQDIARDLCICFDYLIFSKRQATQKIFAICEITVVNSFLIIIWAGYCECQGFFFFCCEFFV